MGLGGGVAAFFGLRAGFAPSFIDDRLRDPGRNEPHGQAVRLPPGTPGARRRRASRRVTAGVPLSEATARPQR